MRARQVAAAQRGQDATVLRRADAHGAAAPPGHTMPASIVPDAVLVCAREGGRAAQVGLGNCRTCRPRGARRSERSARTLHCSRRPRSASRRTSAHRRLASTMAALPDAFVPRRRPARRERGAHSDGEVVGRFGMPGIKPFSMRVCATRSWSRRPTSPGTWAPSTTLPPDASTTTNAARARMACRTVRPGWSGATTARRPSGGCWSPASLHALVRRPAAVPSSGAARRASARSCSVAAR